MWGVGPECFSNTVQWQCAPPKKTEDGCNIRQPNIHSPFLGPTATFSSPTEEFLQPACDCFGSGDIFQLAGYFYRLLDDFFKLGGSFCYITLPLHFKTCIPRKPLTHTTLKTLNHSDGSWTGLTINQEGPKERSLKLPIDNHSTQIYQNAACNNIRQTHHIA